jgi:hypothetical protein
MMVLKINKNRPEFCWIFLDGEVDNIVHIVRVKLVPAWAGTCGFEAIPWARCFRFTLKEELLGILLGTLL